MKNSMEARTASSLAERIYLSERKLWVASSPLIPAFSNAALSASCSVLRVIEAAPPPFREGNSSHRDKAPRTVFRAIPSNRVLSACHPIKSRIVCLPSALTGTIRPIPLPLTASF